MDGGDGNDTVDGGEGDDVLSGGSGNDTIMGWLGSDSIHGGQGDDFIDAGASGQFASADGADTVYGDAGNDTIIGGAGDDQLHGGADADNIDGGTGDDRLYGDDGNDTLNGGLGHDILTGGAGNDVFVVSRGNDKIVDFNFGNTGFLNDGDSTNNDFVDLSKFYNSLSELYADQADDGILNQSNRTDTRGHEVDYSDNARFGDSSITFVGASSDNSSFTTENTGVVCFTSGTAIQTPLGQVLIDNLRVGDLVTTLDNGPQPIRWIGKRHLDYKTLQENPKMRPVLISRGILGVERDLLVSQQHGMLIGKSGEKLARAKHLAENVKGIRIAHGKKSVTYIHLMFDCHQIIISEGSPSESFYPGPMALKMIDEDPREELFSLFPELSIKNINRQNVVDFYGEVSREFAIKNRVKELLKHG